VRLLIEIVSRKLPVVIAFGAALLLATNCTILSGPHMGAVTESFETSNKAFRLRVDRHAEVGGFGPGGAYYVFRTAPPGSDAWRDIMTFRHDDPIPIPRDQVRFLNERVGFVFMGWMYAVTTDEGASWSVWDSSRDMPKRPCCNYRLVKDVHLQADGTGTMTLNLVPDRVEVVQLRTIDFGRHWST
jgi:hypothetical protein